MRTWSKSHTDVKLSSAMSRSNGLDIFEFSFPLGWLFVPDGLVFNVSETAELRNFPAQPSPDFIENR